MDVREKLVELLDDIQVRGEDFTDYEIYGMRVPDTVSNEDVASHLIAHGVTVQEWISVKDRLPEENERVLVWIGNNRYNDVRKDTDRVHNGKWVRWGGCVTHWTPWNMPKPPKGE